MTHARPGTDTGLPHVAVLGDVYTILVSGEQTPGRYTLIDIFVPTGANPPPHRHDFEEIFHVLEGEIEVFFRGAKSIVRAGETVNILANAPHAFKNVADKPAWLPCLASPTGEDQFFLEIGDRGPTRTGPLPDLDEAARAERVAKIQRLATKYQNEILAPQ